MKTLKIAAMAAGVLLLAGCGNKVAQNNSAETGADNASAPRAEEKSAVSSAITSIADAMASGKSMKCTYTISDEEGGEIVSTMFVDGKKYAGTTTVAGSVQHMIFDETAMYSWSEGQKTGMKMTTACSKDLAANAPEDQMENAPATPTDPEETFEGATDVKCEADNGADFSIPTDVTFTDQCEMLKNLTKSLPKGMPTNLPAGVTPPQL